MTVKLSVSLSDDDLVYLDKIAADMRGNRSAAIHRLLRVQRELDAEDAYAQAFDEWESSGENAIWDATARDGLSE
ncbi:antitoxin [Leifsonia sp. TF02-11]|uniref:antitoxin n=1 Tax=Leifsonia sp. TF02-11 TaxID=2815212 RepID=UPI001AA1B2CF|nr:antitoxin [Leifsonia sp. TF02-11]MBO1738947.1 antitoxin [Leifsonia sp. TF02-11]